MSRGVQLGTVVDRLKSEVGYSNAVSVGTDRTPQLRELIRRQQETLYEAYDWPFLRVKPFKDLSAGQRFYDFPTELNKDRIDDVFLWWSNQPVKLERGITMGNYAVYNPEIDQRCDPVQKWDTIWSGDDSGAEQMEVWPIPAANATTSPQHNRLQFFGFRPLRALTSDSDVCDLDDRLLILFAASEILGRDKKEDAQLKLKAAEALLLKLKVRQASGSRTYTMSGGHRAEPTPWRATVRIAGA